jgi:hypothetical protein
VRRFQATGELHASDGSSIGAAMLGHRTASDPRRGSRRSPGS